MKRANRWCQKESHPPRPLQAQLLDSATESTLSSSLDQTLFEDSFVQLRTPPTTKIPVEKITLRTRPIHADSLEPRSRKEAHRAGGVPKYNTQHERHQAVPVQGASSVILHLGCQRQDLPLQAGGAHFHQLRPTFAGRAFNNSL